MSESKEENIQRINGELHTVVAIQDASGNTIHHDVSRLKVELTLTDVMQILVGAAMLAIPTALTEEVWTMGETVSWFNVIAMLVIEYIIIAMFILLEAYQQHIRAYKVEYIKRIVATLILSGLIVGVFLALVGKLPLFSDPDIAIKRIIIGMLPASMSATVLDSFK